MEKVDRGDRRKSSAHLDGTLSWPCYYYGPTEQFGPFFELDTVKEIAEYIRGFPNEDQIHVLEQEPSEFLPNEKDPLYVDAETRVIPPAWRFAVVVEVNHKFRAYELAEDLPHGDWVAVYNPNEDGLFILGGDWYEKEDD